MDIKFHLITLLLILYCSLLEAQVTITQDIDYMNDSVYDNNKDLLDIYMPKGKKGVPVIVYFHGGALLYGDKSMGKEIGRKLAESGIGLVSVNYRLSPEFKHPTHANDAASATEWVIKNIEAYGGNPKQVFVGGHSAGAYLAALLAIDPSLLKVNDTADFKIAGAILISPFLFVEETARDRIETDSAYKTIWGNNPDKWLEASVTPHIDSNRDNILLIYADGDDAWRKAQNERFAKMMTDVGNLNVTANEVPNRDHASIITAISDNDDQLVNLINQFVWKK
jgi:acetyl esterase/lipase